MDNAAIQKTYYDTFYADMLRTHSKKSRDRIFSEAQYIEGQTSKYIENYNTAIRSRGLKFRDAGIYISDEEVPLIRFLDLDEILDFSGRVAKGHHDMSFFKAFTDGTALDSELSETQEMYKELTYENWITESIRNEWSQDYLKAIEELKETPSRLNDESDNATLIVNGTINYNIETFFEYRNLAHSTQIILDYYKSEDSFGTITKDARMKENDILYLSQLFEKNANILAFTFFIDYRLFCLSIDEEDNEVEKFKDLVDRQDLRYVLNFYNMDVRN